MNPKRLQEERTRKKVLDAMRGDGIELLLDSESNPTVHNPHDVGQKDWPADSQRVSDLVTMFWLSTHGDYPKPNELAWTLSHIRELCRMGGQRPSEDEESKIESNPIVQGVLLVMNQRERFDDLTTILHNEILNAQNQKKIDQFPEVTPFSNIFARQMRRLIPAMKSVSISVEFRHQEDGSYCKLSRLPGFQVEPDRTTATLKKADGSCSQDKTKPSVPTPARGNDFDKADESDGKIRVESPSPEKNLEQGAAAMISESPTGNPTAGMGGDATHG